MLRTALDFGKGTIRAFEEGSGTKTYSDRLYCSRCSRGFEPLDPRLFSFNSRQGQCPECEGIGSLEDIVPGLLFPDAEKSVSQTLEEMQAGALRKISRRLLQEIREKTRLPLQLPLKKMEDSDRGLLLWGANGEGNDSGFRGLVPLLREYREFADTDELEAMEPFMGDSPCPRCGGSRLREEARAVLLKGVGIGELTSLPAADALKMIDAYRFRGREARIADGIMKELLPRLEFLNEVGLGYLGLDRRGDTLSGGEAQRIRLAAQLGSNLRGICYILDEPTIGLHPRDNKMLISTLRKLQQRGNSILVVEHDEETIRSADHIIDLGPGAGPEGGRIIAQGTMKEIRANPASVTGAFLNGRERKIDSRLTLQRTVAGAARGSPPQFKKGLLPFPRGRPDVRHWSERLRQIHAGQGSAVPGPEKGPFRKRLRHFPGKYFRVGRHNEGRGDRPFAHRPDTALHARHVCRHP